MSLLFKRHMTRMFLGRLSKRSSRLTRFQSMELAFGFQRRFDTGYAEARRRIEGGSW